ncbi:hypothetical protein COV82_01225 [Candidatus Peregrinibacteria bacterium CG11_big_fil_rev_8_21_14_0_20_46_8]|nr:MAG: hypothetical protein COV82_01225 [Candidatus Peregrinibacteria bacterium CG11_big_fil_rev_8_21_14_0_20_46_8]
MFYNWNLIGHEKELALLERDIRSGSTSHAYLFVGPKKIGKFRVARSFATILQCPDNYCKKCPTCIQIEKHGHPDTIEFKDTGETLKIESVRTLIERLSLTSQSNYKIVLMESIDRLTLDAANALLKILEEPPPKTLFILTAESLRRVLPTIVSRVRRITFTMPPQEKVKTALDTMFPEIDSELRANALFLSQGRSGHAIQLLQNPEALQELLDMYRHIQFLDENASIATRMNTVQDLVKEKETNKLETFLPLCAHYFRQKMLSTKNSAVQLKTIAILKQLDSITELMQRNVNTRLLLEHFMLSL